jgi:methyl acetate hydrolase
MSDVAITAAGIDGVLERAVESGVVPGVAATVTTKGGVRYHGVFGTADVESGAPMAQDSLFRISSWTKSLVGVALMQLVERGLVDLDQTVASIVPEFGEIQVLEGFDGDTPILRAPKTQATIAHLATHTSGLAYDVWSEKILRYQELTGAPSSFTGRREGMFLPLAFDPGTDWGYGTGTDWIGEVIQVVTGRRIDEYLQKEVFEPLGMVDTTFAPDETQRKRLVAVHARDGHGGFVATPFDWAPANRVLSGHGLYSTVNDYSAYLKMLLNDGAVDGKQILRPETIANFIENRISDVDVTVMRAAIPHLTRDAEFFPGMPKKHSIGFQMTTTQRPGMRAAGSQFWAGLFNLFYWWDLENEIAVTFATQMLPFQDERVMEVFADFERAVYKREWV